MKNTLTKLVFTVLAVLLAQVCVAKELKVAVGLSLPPYIIQDSDNGMEVDILRQALADSGNTAKLVYVPFIRVPTSLSDGTAEAALTVNEAREIKDVVYSDSHITYQNVAIMLKSNPLKVASIADLGKVSVVAFQDATKYLGPEFAAMAKTNSKYAEQGKQELQVKMLFGKRTDIIVTDINIYKYFKQSIKDMDTSAEISIIELFPPTNYKVAFKDKAVCDLFNAGLKKLKENGQYDAILNKYTK